MEKTDNPELILEEVIHQENDFHEIVDNDILDNNIEKIQEIPEIQENKKYSADFLNLCKAYYQTQPYVRVSKLDHELEVRFGTFSNRQRNITKTDYDNVIKKIKSIGFSSINESGEYSLRIQNEFLDNKTGKFIISRSSRIEIYGLQQIQIYCRTNDIQTVLKSAPSSVIFNSKKPAFTSKGERIAPVYMNDFGFVVSYQTEEEVKQNIRTYIAENWKQFKKTFRYLNRVRFSHSEWPVFVDVSIVKTSIKDSSGYKRFYTTTESGVFQNPSIYEIEIEVDNSKIGPGTMYNTPETIMKMLKKAILLVLGGIQNTNYPIGSNEQQSIITSYMILLHKELYKPGRPVYGTSFIGPSSYTLQMRNIIPVNDESTVPNIRNNFVVTEKADGERHMLYIHTDGKIYLFNSNMQLFFTGAKTSNKNITQTLIDGEWIKTDKTGQYLNLYAAFDIYYFHGTDVRSLPFINVLKGEEIATEIDKEEYRYTMLVNVIETIKPYNIVNEKNGNAKEIDQMKTSPIRIDYKQFYPNILNKDNQDKKYDIFEACNNILLKEKEGLFPYMIDGLIFTHTEFGVGGNQKGKTGPLNKITWEYSFKWKPPKYNTIDFLVTTIKNKMGQDKISIQYEPGTNIRQEKELLEYKTVQLKCSFIEKIHGYINPCQDVIDDIIPHNEVLLEQSGSTNRQSTDVTAQQFYPTNPYDPEAGICNIELKKDGNLVKQMFTLENEVFMDNTIVEFSYDFNRDKGWRWVPLRVRYDKTSEMLQGQRNFGNAYHVANSNWGSIHNPITTEMICTGEGIPTLTIDSDVYYNKTGIEAFGKRESATGGLRIFHNVYVKKLLIDAVSHKGAILIDFACGKGGDIPKWIHAHLGFVFGIDISKDNLENRLDGACARYLNYRKTYKQVPSMLFVNGNSAFNIRNGEAFLNDKAVQISGAVFGKSEVTKNEDILGKGVYKVYGKGINGFHISSCQFALHYFFESISTFMGFMRNISECTMLGGYFIGTCYDGETLFQKLKKKESGESIQIMEEGQKIWSITKQYNQDVFEGNINSIGLRIDVFQESINQTIKEWLVHFTYFTRIMELFGFALLTDNESREIGLSHSTGMFNELYDELSERVNGKGISNKSSFIRQTRNKEEESNILNMTENEKTISFLNRYFVFKKIRNVEAHKIQLDSSISEDDQEETDKAIQTAKKEIIKIKPKIRKLKQKLLLVEATATPSK